MDWRDPITVLFPTLEGAVLAHLHLVSEPCTAGQVRQATGAGSLNGIRKALDRLAEQGLVVALAAGNAYLYLLNREHLAYPALAAALGAYRPEALLRERLAALVAEHTGTWVVQPSVAIVGPVARGTAGPDADLDLLLLHDASTGEEATGRLEVALRRHAERWTGNPVQVHTRTLGWLAAAHAAGDPLPATWAAEALTVHGPEVRQLLPAGAA